MLIVLRVFCVFTFVYLYVYLFVLFFLVCNARNSLETW